MKKFLFGLIAMVLLSTNLNAQDRFRSADWKFVGDQHNEQLDDVYNYIKNNRSIQKKGIMEPIKNYMINNVNKTSDEAQVKKQTIANINKFSMSFGTLKNLYPDGSLAKNLTTSEKRYLDKLFNILKETNLTAATVKNRVDELENEINTDLTLNNTNLATLYAATNTAKSSAAYWEKNTDKWITLGGGTPQTTAMRCCGDGVVGADIAGGTMAALTTWAANAVPGAGQIAYGSAIVGGAAIGSIGKAVENFVNQWF